MAFYKFQWHIKSPKHSSARKPENVVFQILMFSCGCCINSAQSWWLWNLHIRENSFIGRQINSFVLHKGMKEEFWEGTRMFSFGLEKERKSWDIQKGNELMIMKEFEKCCGTLKTQEGWRGRAEPIGCQQHLKSLSSCISS